MIKLLGVSLISYAVFVAGRNISKSIKRKIDADDGIISLIEYTKEMIKSSGMSLNDIYVSFDDRRLDVDEFYEKLRGKECNCLISALGCLKEKCDKKIYEVATAYARSIGNCYDNEDAVSLCEKFISQMKLYITPVHDIDKKREQMYSKLSFVFACGVFLLCI